MFTVELFTAHRSANACVIREDGRVLLQSYRTIVCELTTEGWLTCYGTYSATTRKHICWFMREYAPAPMNCYNVAKKAYEDGYKINLYTGEIVRL